MHYSMGGLWVDYNQCTNIPGIFAAGECEYQYHGANRLGANSLVSCIFGGAVAGPQAVQLCAGAGSRRPMGTDISTAEQKKQEESNALLMKNEGTENPVKLWRELGELMTRDCTVIRYNKNLLQTDAKLVEMLERYRKSILAIAPSGRTPRWFSRGSFTTCCNWRG